MIRSLIGIVAAAATIASWPMFRPSSSNRLTAEGRSAFVQGRMSDAAASFDAAASIRPDEIARFNLGTAKLAAGDATGAPILDEIAAGARPVGRDALFNLGNAALSAKQWDDAIARYAEVLRRSPRDADAKRNLEIALRQRQQEQELGDQGKSSPQPTPSQGEEERQQQPQPSEPGEGKDEMTPEEILRSIAQQEKEELRRMRKEKAGEERPVGW